MYVNVEDGLSCCAAAVDTNVVSVWGHLLVKHFLAFIQDFKNSSFSSVVVSKKSATHAAWG